MHLLVGLYAFSLLFLITMLCCCHLDAALSAADDFELHFCGCFPHIYYSI